MEKENSTSILKVIPSVLYIFCAVRTECMHPLPHHQYLVIYLLKWSIVSLSSSESGPHTPLNNRLSKCQLLTSAAHLEYMCTRKSCYLAAVFLNSEQAATQSALYDVQFNTEGWFLRIL